ncbi:hypothetical protein [Streptomyces piniterrae]|uniref:hypothetical protein n=1 Tax=Streptomyces piniterrae TaxID=2571125 RepID=UPI00145C8B89|nr:hypothetical protein [Streptomyces piniterrae]
MALAGVVSAAFAQLGHAGTTDTEVAIKREKVTDLTAYHGVKPGDVEKVLKKIQRPDNGTAGNDNADWKAFYLAETPQHAAEYVNGEPDPKTYKVKAGEVVQVKLNGEVELATVSGSADSPEVVQQLKKEFHIPEGRPLMDALGEQNVVLKIKDGTTEKGVERFEIIVPWSIAEKHATATRHAHFPDPRGSDKAEEFSRMSPEDAAKYVGECLSGGSRTKRAAAASVCELAKDKARDILSEAGNEVSLPQRDSDGLSKQEITATAEATRSKLGTGVHGAVSAAMVADWAHDVARTFADPKATKLDKAAAVTAIAPVIGQAVNIADGIQHHDKKTIVVNSLVLAAVVAAQAVPAVGEVVDAAIVADFVVEKLVGWFTPTAKPGPEHVAPPSDLVETPQLDKDPWMSDPADTSYSKGATAAPQPSASSGSAGAGQESKKKDTGKTDDEAAIPDVQETPIPNF